MLKFKAHFHALLLAAIVLTFANAQAEDADKGQKLETIKQEMTKHLDERIQSLQAAKTCVTAAADRDALRSCRDQAREDMMEHRGEMHDRKMKHHSDRKARIEEHKKSMQGKGP